MTPAPTRSATSSQTLAYLVFVTDRYPSADPTALLAQLEPPPRHPVRLVGDSDDLRRSRLTVFFRLPLAIPLYVWLLLWSVAAFFAVIAQWFVTLVRGVPAAPLHRFLASYVRFGFRVGAFFFLAANPFPGFGGAAGHYPLDLELPQPGPQNRWKTGFRLILCVPAVVVSSATGARPPHRGHPDLVRGARHRLGARRTAQPLRLRAPLQRADERVRVPGHRRLSAREPARGRRRRAGLPRGGADRPGCVSQRIPRLAALVALAALWSVGAWLLWRSTVPSSLHLPHLSARDSFSAAELHRAASFARVDGLIWIGGVLVELVVFVLYAWRGGRFARESAAGPIGTGMLLGMLGFALLWLAELPFDVLGFWWARRHGLTHGGYVTTLLGSWLSLGGQFVFLCVALAIVMWLARRFVRWWWVLAAPVFVALALLFAFVSPYLATTHALESPGSAPAGRDARGEDRRRQDPGGRPGRARGDLAAERRGDGHRPEPPGRALGHDRRRALLRSRARGRDRARARATSRATTSGSRSAGSRSSPFPAPT